MFQNINKQKIKNGETMGYARDLFGEYINQAVNTKEDYEILNGLTIGNKTYEEKETVRTVKVAKIIDML